MPAARFDAIWITLAFTSYKDFKFFQIDVKSAFLNDFIEEEVFADPTHPDFVFKLDKTLYGLKQALELRMKDFQHF